MLHESKGLADTRPALPVRPSVGRQQPVSPGMGADTGVAQVLTSRTMPPEVPEMPYFVPALEHPSFSVHEVETTLPISMRTALGAAVRARWPLSLFCIASYLTSLLLLCLPDRIHGMSGHGR